jgi:hypothetical protein
MGALLKLEALGKLSHFIENRWAFGALMEPKGRGWESSKDAAPKIEKKSSQKWNCASSDPISKFIYLSDLYIPTIGLPKIGGPILGIYCINRSKMYAYVNMKLGNKAAQFDF